MPRRDVGEGLRADPQVRGEVRGPGRRVEADGVPRAPGEGERAHHLPVPVAGEPVGDAQHVVTPAGPSGRGPGGSGHEQAAAVRDPGEHAAERVGQRDRRDPASRAPCRRSPRAERARRRARAPSRAAGPAARRRAAGAAGSPGTPRTSRSPGAPWPRSHRRGRAGRGRRGPAGVVSARRRGWRAPCSPDQRHEVALWTTAGPVPAVDRCAPTPDTRAPTSSSPPAPSARRPRRPTRRRAGTTARPGRRRASAGPGRPPPR